LYKFKIYIWYQRCVGFRGIPFSSRVWIRTVISLFTTRDLWYWFSRLKEMANNSKMEIEMFNGKSFDMWKVKMEYLLVDIDQGIAVDPCTAATRNSTND
jgi:hypothetical protein